MKSSVSHRSAPPQTPHFGLRTSDFGLRAAPRGVALVITLILLAIITFMAVTFLVLSRSQRFAVNQTTESAIARQAADIALQRAQADLLSGMMVANNENNYDLRVPTNFISTSGFQKAPAAVYTSISNVCYSYENGSPLIGNDLYQNLQNLTATLNPRAPVFMLNRRTGSNEFRFFLNLNRNTNFDGSARFETNGLLPVISPDPANPFINAFTGARMPTPLAGQTLSNFFVGDPEWVGGLDRPDQRHSPTNRFIYRWTYFAIPIGKTLDLNYIHNYAKLLTPNAMLPKTGDGFFRNQGVGSWEVNLAGFLVDLNTNLWPPPRVPAGAYGTAYSLDLSVSQPNTGAAFDDAMSLLRWRYAKNWGTLYKVNQLFPPPNSAVSSFGHDYVDGFSHGPIMSNTWWQPPNNVDPDAGFIANSFPWPGSENQNHYFTTQDLFDKAKTFSASGAGVTFTDRLMEAGTNNDSYNRYTFYRLSAQLATDSAPEANKLNLNYRNVDNNGVIIPNLATNFIPWDPVQFFTNAAIRMLANAGYTKGVGPTNMLVTNNLGVTSLRIMIWPQNFYTPSVHRLLQLAANIYDATTNRTLGVSPAYPYFPTVFQPLFQNIGTNVFIVGYREAPPTKAILQANIHDLSDPTRRVLQPGQFDMVYGVPLIIGAKKGFPGLNKMSLETQVEVSRKLEFRRPDITKDVNETNQMYMMMVTNTFGVAAWNSYSNSYPRDLQIIAAADLFAVVTNELGGSASFLMSHSNIFGNFPHVIPANTWPGAFNSAGGLITTFTNSCQFPLTSNFLHLARATYFDQAHRFVALNGNFERNRNFYVPHWWLNLRTRLRFILVDVPANRIIDYVNLDSAQDVSGPQGSTDLTSVMMQDVPNGPINQAMLASGQQASPASLWYTNRYNAPATLVTAPTLGIMNQWQVCLGTLIPQMPGAGRWDDVNGIPSGNTDRAKSFFNYQFGLGANDGTLSKSNIFYAPFVPTRNIYFLNTWEANDPLVHYTIGDLVDLRQTNQFVFDLAGISTEATNFNTLNARYRPWGGNPGGSTDTNAYNVAIKDPMVWSSDSWEFPTNKFPNIGWLGRVHRGTPWQTVYLKSPVMDVLGWAQWSGNGVIETNWGQLDSKLVPTINTNLNVNAYRFANALLTAPTNDFYVLDLFSTSFSDSAGRGKLSINQNNLAAWSAILSGVIALTNRGISSSTLRDVLDWQVSPSGPIEPAGIYNSFVADPFHTNGPAIVRIVNGINDQRARMPRKTFSRLGEILLVPELTVRSPFIKTNVLAASAGSTRSTLNDAVLERLPQQILGLLQADPTPRFLVYAYGQALKPADRSLVTSGAYFGLCTNYQVVAEAATRTVIRIDGVPIRMPGTPAQPLRNLHPVIESFNILPPEQ